MQKFDHLNLSGRLLKLFLAVYDTNSVSRAAGRLRINQSTVSHGLDNLRDIMGDQLFVRSGRGITPTDLAIAAAPQIRHLLASMEGLVNYTTYDPSQDDRPISIAGYIDAQSDLFKKIRDKLFETAPSTELQFIEAGARSSNAGLLEDGLADVLIGVHTERNSGAIMFRRLFDSGMMCFYDRKMRKGVRSPKTYMKARHAVVGYRQPGASIVDEALRDVPGTRNIALRAPNFSALARLMEGTDLIATMPNFLSTTVLKSFATCIPPVPTPDVQTDLMWHIRSDQSARNLWLRKLILDCV